jgi:hypothetical protein
MAGARLDRKIKLNLPVAYQSGCYQINNLAIKIDKNTPTLNFSKKRLTQKVSLFLFYGNFRDLRASEHKVMHGFSAFFHVHPFRFVVLHPDQGVCD